MVEEIRLAGITPFTMIDFPGRRAAVLLLQGCEWRCHHCQDVRIQPRERQSGTPDWPDALAWLADRRGLLDGILLSGGEPLLQHDLLAAIGEIHGMGFEVGLHTSGVYPERLAVVLSKLAWVGLDFKMPLSRYAELTGAAAGEKVLAAMRMLMAHGGNFEIRSTVDAKYHDVKALDTMRKELMDSGIPLARWVLQVQRKAPSQICVASQQLAKETAIRFGIALRE
jgi:pyruvate formate lyase activating enzyme